MLVVGLTGGIGSGKSTVAKLFADKGVRVIDTDQLARDLTQLNQPAFKKIIEKFGTALLNEDGTLNRAALRKIVFADPEKRMWLEKLLHPFIRMEIKRQIKINHSPYCIVMIPLLLETKPNPLIQRILVVDATEEQQIERAHTRDKLSIEEIKTIMQSQVKRDQRLAAADDIIDNAGQPEGLTSQVNKLHEFYLSIAKR